MRHNTLLSIVMLPLLLAVACGALWRSSRSLPSAPDPVVLFMRAAPGDSIMLVATWDAPVVDPANQLPISDYQVIWRLNNVGNYVNRNVTTTRDSIIVPRPPLGTASTSSVTVRARDTAGTLSASVTSPTITFRREVLPPSPPGGLGIDSLTIAQIIVRPSNVTLEVGDSIQLCALVRYNTGRWGYSPPIPYCADQLDIHLANPIQVALGA